MEIIHKNEGTYVAYQISGNKITFNEEFMVNLSKYERDDEVILDICRDNKTGALVTGVPEIGKYVAQIIIPPREYVASTLESQEMMTEETLVGKDAADVAVTFAMDKCTLSLWAI